MSVTTALFLALLLDPVFKNHAILRGGWRAQDSIWFICNGEALSTLSGFMFYVSLLPLLSPVMSDSFGNPIKHSCV